jgi:uncharacterized membrane-anchored protein YjiN (DUF445 family)
MRTRTAGDTQRKSVIREHLGPFSLGVALVGFGVTEFALTMRWIGGTPWRIVAGAFEAATVGGMADWFAVRALFREMKIPFLKISIPHTNIIIKNRQKITDGIVDLVENQLLTPEGIKERLKSFSASRHLLEQDKEQGEWIETILPVLRNLLSEALSALSSERAISYMQEVLRDGVRTIDFSRHLGRWMKTTLRGKKHEPLLDYFLESIDKNLQNRQTQQIVLDFLRRMVKELSERSWLHSIGLRVALRVINESELTEALLRRAVLHVNEAKNHVDHPLRRGIDDFLLNVACRLESGDPKATEIIQTLTTQLTERAETSEWIRTMLQHIHRALDNGLSESKSLLIGDIITFVYNQLEKFRNNEDDRSRLDAWVREKLLEISVDNKREIGLIVRKSLDRMDPGTLVSLIETKVGRDLQFIRLNGAVVGGLVGALLNVLKVVFHR